VSAELTLRARAAGFELLLRPLIPRDEVELLRIHSTPGVARWWGEPEEGFPWSDEPEQTRLAIVLDGVLAGMVQYREEPTPKEPTPRYEYATIDLFLDPAVHGRGVGTEALRLLAAHLFDECGHHRLTIDPSTDNAAAIRCYEKVGFRRVGVMRHYERRADGSFGDGLLMELIADR
jgi:aminoglycoside 6'-N-acetyltransferase